MRIDLTSPYDQSIKATVVISEMTGEAVLESGEGADLEGAIANANDSRHGGIESWVPTLDYLVNWALARGIHISEHGTPNRAEVDPDLVY